MTHLRLERGDTIAPGRLKSRDGWLRISANQVDACHSRFHLAATLPRLMYAACSPFVTLCDDYV